VIVSIIMILVLKEYANRLSIMEVRDNSKASDALGGRGSEVRKEENRRE
jgi:hypothetical protein